MATSLGGLFNRPAGKVSGTVWQSARTKHGKKATVRELVIPTNPRSEFQYMYRAIMNNVTSAVSAVGREHYREPWKGQVRGLAGYQSLLTLIRKSYGTLELASTGYFSRLRPQRAFSNLGTLHTPEQIQPAPLSSTVMRMEWSTENGVNGLPTDKAVLIVLPHRMSFGVSGQLTPITVNTDFVRSDGFAQFPAPTTQLGSIPDASTIIYFTRTVNDRTIASKALWVPVGRRHIPAGLQENHNNNNNEQIEK